MDCYSNGEIIQRKEATKRNIGRYDYQTYFYKSGYCFRREDVDLSIDLDKQELDDLKLSERYGYLEDEDRERIIKYVVDKKHLDQTKIDNDVEVDMFIEYGLIKDDDEKDFFKRLIKRCK